MSNCILIIDDMAETLIMLMAYLTSQGYKVTTARNGLEALSLIDKQLPDLIISDIMMPKMGGFEFVQKIKQTYPFISIPIMFMSVKDGEMVEQTALDLGAVAFLQKPISLTMVKNAIETVLTNNVKHSNREWPVTDEAALIY
jgi:CheY-like chemotaxis protein